MKIAVCFSGQPRFIPECATSILENFLTLYDVDIYAHFWWHETMYGKPFHHEYHDVVENKDPIYDFYRIYQPKKLVFQEPMQIDLSSFAIQSQEPDLSHLTQEELINMFERYHYQWYSVKESYKLIEHPEDYDLIVRMRTDLVIHQPLHLTNLHNNCVYIQNGYVAGRDRDFGDWFAVGAPTVMKEFMHLYDSIGTFWKHGVMHIHRFIPYAMIEKITPCIPYEFNLGVDYSHYRSRKT